MAMRFSPQKVLVTCVGEGTRAGWGVLCGLVWNVLVSLKPSAFSQVLVLHGNGGR